jgi:hypothetical protein
MPARSHQSTRLLRPPGNWDLQQCARCKRACCRHAREGIRRRKRHLAVEIDIKDCEMGSISGHTLQSRLYRGKRPGDLKSRILQGVDEIERQKHVVFHDHDANICWDRHWVGAPRTVTAGGNLRRQRQLKAIRQRRLRSLAFCMCDLGSKIPLTVQRQLDSLVPEISPREFSAFTDYTPLSPPPSTRISGTTRQACSMRSERS